MSLAGLRQTRLANGRTSQDGNVELVQAASVSLHGPHGQHIENVHLEQYISDEHFWEVLYKERYSQILRKAEQFIEGTGEPGSEVLVFIRCAWRLRFGYLLRWFLTLSIISCGFDACEHEYPSMSRHGRRVPASFYHRFTRDACAFADKYAHGKLISVLEGGYSDQALISGAMAHLVGLANEGAKIDETWWSLDNVNKVCYMFIQIPCSPILTKMSKVEKAVKKRKGGRTSLNTQQPESWLERTLSIFSEMNSGYAEHFPSSSSRNAMPPSTMNLRTRKPVSTTTPTSGSPGTSPKKNDAKSHGGSAEREGLLHDPAASVPDRVRTVKPIEAGREVSAAMPRKLPKVILRLGPRPVTPPAGRNEEP